MADNLRLGSSSMVWLIRLLVAAHAESRAMPFSPCFVAKLTMVSLSVSFTAVLMAGVRCMPNSGIYRLEPTYHGDVHRSLICSQNQITPPAIIAGIGTVFGMSDLPVFEQLPWA